MICGILSISKVETSATLQSTSAALAQLYTHSANVLLLRTLQGKKNSETGVHQVSASQRAKKVPH